MKSTGHYESTDKEISKEDALEQEMLQEVQEQRDNLRRYTNNIDSLLGKKLSSEVKKSMINFLVEQL